MTEAEWLACEITEPMLKFVQPRADDRKLRLFSCACCRRGWHFLKEPKLQAAIEALERFADGQAKDRERIDARKTGLHFAQAQATGRTPEGLIAWEVWGAGVKTITRSPRDLGGSAAASFGYAAVSPAKVGGPAFFQASRAERKQQTFLLRDIFGNPFQPVTLDPGLLTWNGGLIPKLASAAYQERQLPEGTLDGARLAVLADALEEAGCTDPAVLEHCRAPEPYRSFHVRGCWVIDLLRVCEEVVRG